MSLSAIKINIEKTSEARFNQAKRLAFHAKASDITLAVVSTTLVAIPLINTFELAKPYSDKYINFIQIIFAISVLIQSIFLSKADFKLNSHLAHRCGMELREILHSIEFDNDKASSSEINNKYNSCIKSYSNHKDIDYLMAKLENHKKWNGAAPTTRAHLIIKFKYACEFSIYLITIIVVIGWTGLFLEFS